MRTKRWRTALLALPLALALPAAAIAGDTKPPADPKADQKAEEMAREAERMAKQAVDKLLGALRMVIDSVPQYEAPEVLDNGDIIIRRKHPEDDVPSNKGGDTDETRT